MRIETTLLVVVLAYTLVMNVATYLVYAADKRRAEQGAWRIRKRTLLLLAVLGGALGAFFAMRHFHHKTRKRKFTWTVTPLMVVQVLSLVLFLGFTAFTSRVYAATDEALAALESNEQVAVSEDFGGYLFDGVGTQDVLVFYPGALVDERAYAPLMQRIAAGGVDCVLLRVPYHVGFLGINQTDAVQRADAYAHCYVGGHSLGGYASSLYAASHTDEIAGMMLCASYTDKDFTQSDLAVLSTYGTNDQVLNREHYDKNRASLPEGAAELVIEGGNHAQFGNYGAQAGDGDASISSDEQQALAANAFLAMVEARELAS
ncbi:MAG: DUF1294 domain-containing protein [Coriobacteriales bacterium]|nr:DUF1294 domain-containing protein [Coriobacteriales bacterium]